MEQQGKILRLTSIFSAIVSVILTLITIILNYLLPAVETYEQLIISYFQNQMLHSSISFLSVISVIFIIPAIVGIFNFYREQLSNKIRKLVAIPFIFVIIGAIIIAAMYIFNIYIIYKLAPDYNSLIVEQATILTRFEHWVFIIEIFNSISYVFLYTIGAGGFGLIGLRTPNMSSSNAWLGLACGFLGFFKIFFFLSNNVGAVFSLMSQIGAILFFFWLAGIAIVMIQYHRSQNIAFQEITE